MKLSPLSLVFIFCMINSASASTTKPLSHYTNIHACKIMQEDKETGGFSKFCPGILGFNLKIFSDDDRMSINVVSPDKKDHPRDYWDVVTNSFSNITGRAEWRVIKKDGKQIPISLIIKLNTTDQQDVEKPKKVPVFVITKIQEDKICVTDVIKVTHQSTIKEARKLADKSTEKPCLPKI